MKNIRKIYLLSMICFVWNSISAQRNINEQTIKYNELLRMIDRFHVDTVNVARLTEVAITRLLEELDPHSIYLSREDVKEANEPLD